MANLVFMKSGSVLEMLSPTLSCPFLSEKYPPTVHSLAIETVSLSHTHTHTHTHCKHRYLTQISHVSELFTEKIMIHIFKSREMKEYSVFVRGQTGRPVLPRGVLSGYTLTQ